MEDKRLADVLDTAAAGELVGLSEDSIKKYIQRGLLPAKRLGARTHAIHRASLLEWNKERVAWLEKRAANARKRRGED